MEQVFFYVFLLLALLVSLIVTYAIGYLIYRTYESFKDIHKDDDYINH